MCGFSCFCSVFLKCKSVDSLAFQAHNVNHFRFYSFPFAVYKLWIFSLLMRFRWFRMLPSNKCIWNTLLLSALDRGGHGRDAFDLLAAPRASQKPSCRVLIEHVQRCCIRLMYGKWGRRWAEREKCAFCWRYSRSPVVPRTCKYVFSSQHVCPVEAGQVPPVWQLGVICVFICIIRVKLSLKSMNWSRLCAG